MIKIINIDEIMKKKFFFIFLISFFSSSLLTFYINLNFNLLDENYGSLDYIGPALILNNTSSINDFFYSLSSRMPTYPLLISFLFKIFGNNNYLSILLFQCFLHSITTVILLKTVQLFTKKFFLISFCLIAFNPNMFWHTSIILPETLFIFFISIGLYFFICIFKKKFLLKNVFLSSVFFGFAYITKPSAIYIPYILFLFILFFTYFKQKILLPKCIMLSLIPLVISFFLASPIYYFNYLNTNKITYSYQKGGHLLQYVYPCLSKKWGCGSRDKEALKKAIKLQEEAFKNNKDLNNKETKLNKLKKSTIESKIQKEIFYKLLKEDIEKEKILTSIIGYSSKFMLHTSIIFPLQKHGISYEEFSYISYGKENFSLKKYHFFWLLPQFFLIFLRFIQFFSLKGILTYDRKNMWPIIFLICINLYFIIVSFGVGNFRYRMPIEPALSIMTILGILKIKKEFKSFFITNNKKKLL